MCVGFSRYSWTVEILLKQVKAEATCRLTTLWLVNNHLGHHVTQSIDYQNIMLHLDPNNKPLGRTTFLAILLTMFNYMIAGIKKLFDANIKNMARLKLLNVGHDI